MSFGTGSVLFMEVSFRGVLIEWLHCIMLEGTLACSMMMDVSC